MKLKNILTLILGIILVLSLAACASGTKLEKQNDSSIQAVSEKTDEQDNNTETSDSSEQLQVTDTEAQQEEPADNNDQSVSDKAIEQDKEIEASDSSEQLQVTDTEAQQEKPADNNETDTPTESAPDVLVVVFSATGTTKGVAKRIVSVTGADLYEIIPAEPYSDADLNYNDSSSRSTKEQNDKNARPAIASGTLDLSGYKTIYIGFPIWWGEEPRIMDTFVESYDFSGITLIPFCTSGGSGIGRSGPNMESLAGSGNWLAGKRFSGSVSEDELRSWIESLQ